jgi:hypothetical protein
MESLPEVSEPVKCACGCGCALPPRSDTGGKPRFKYLHGHYQRTPEAIARIRATKIANWQPPVFVDDGHEWRVVPGFLGVAVSADGRLRSEVTGKTLSPNPAGPGRYLAVVVGPKKGVRHSVYVHRAVLLAFVGPCPEGMEALHIDGNNRNNTVANLRWGTHRENMDDRTAHGGNLQGTRSSAAKIDDDIVREIRRRRANGETIRSIAGRLPISQCQVDRIVKRKRWAHVV